MFVLQCGQSPLDFDFFDLAQPKAPKRPAALVRPKVCFASTLLFDPVHLFQGEAHLFIPFSLILGDVLLPREGALIGVRFNLHSIGKPLFPFDGAIVDEAADQAQKTSSTTSFMSARKRLTGRKPGFRAWDNLTRRIGLLSTGGAELSASFSGGWRPACFLMPVPQIVQPRTVNG